MVWTNLDALLALTELIMDGTISPEFNELLIAGCLAMAEYNGG